MKIFHFNQKGGRFFKPVRFNDIRRKGIFHMRVIDGGEEDHSYYLDDREENDQWGVDRWVSRKELDEIVNTGKIYGVNYGYYDGCTSLKALLRKIRKWNLPKGIKFEVHSTYSYPLYIITT